MKLKSPASDESGDLIKQLRTFNHYGVLREEKVFRVLFCKYQFKTLAKR